MWCCQHCEKEFVHQSSLCRHVRFAHQKRLAEQEKEEKLAEDGKPENKTENEIEKESFPESEKEEKELNEKVARSAQSAAAWIELIQIAVAKLTSPASLKALSPVPSSPVSCPAPKKTTGSSSSNQKLESRNEPAKSKASHSTLISPRSTASKRSATKLPSSSTPIPAKKQRSRF
jgi:hypothetical protein